MSLCQMLLPRLWMLVRAALRVIFAFGFTPDWLDWAINERTLDWIVEVVFKFSKKKLAAYMEKKNAATTTVAHFGEDGKNDG